MYIDPPPALAEPDTDAVVSWWVVDDPVGSDLERALDRFVPRWRREVWRFERVEFSP